MKNLSTFVLCLVVGINDVVSAFSFQSNNVQPTSVVKEDGTTTRRNWIDQVVTASIATVAMTAAGTVTTTATIEPAHASGGATAGGAYLLSAKQRYNDRVKKSVTALLAVGEALAAGSSKEAKAYFTEEDAGSYKDLTAAGYLLSNAFRRNSTTPPDSLPAVKKYKAFAAEVANLQKVLKKKGAAAASETFPKVEETLEEWLSEVELPSAREL